MRIYIILYYYSWIKFARLALKREQMALCKETIEMLKNEFNQN